MCWARPLAAFDLAYDALQLSHVFDEERTNEMRIPIYQVDAFASKVFSGNPAAVCMLDAWIDDKRLQSIAAENNLSETSFLVRNDDGFDLRWFTPITEVALC